MSDHAHSHPADVSGHGHDEHDHGGLGKYLYVFGALCVLTAMSFWTYSDWPVKWPFDRKEAPAVGWAFMMAVACSKAMLVILFFMHVKYEASWKYVLTVPPAIMSILLMCALIPDIGMRLDTVAGGRTPSEERLSRMAAFASEEQHIELQNKAHAEEAAKGH